MLTCLAVLNFSLSLTKELDLYSFFAAILFGGVSYFLLNDRKDLILFLKCILFYTLIVISIILFIDGNVLLSPLILVLAIPASVVLLNYLILTIVKNKKQRSFKYLLSYSLMVFAICFFVLPRIHFENKVIHISKPSAYRANIVSFFKN